MKKYSWSELLFLVVIAIFIGFFWGIATNKNSISEIEKAVFEIHCQEQKNEMEIKRHLECKIPYKEWKFVIVDGGKKLIKKEK